MVRWRGVPLAIVAVLAASVCLGPRPVEASVLTPGNLLVLGNTPAPTLFELDLAGNVTGSWDISSYLVQGSAMDFDSSGRLYVVEQSQTGPVGPTMHVFDSDLGHLGSWAVTASTTDKRAGFRIVNDTVYIGAGNSNGLQKYSLAGSSLGHYSWSSANVTFVDYGADGQLYTTDDQSGTSNDSITYGGLDGTVAGSFGTGQIYRPAGFEVLSDDIYAAYGENRVARYSPGYGYIGSTTFSDYQFVNDLTVVGDRVYLVGKEALLTITDRDLNTISTPSLSVGVNQEILRIPNSVVPEPGTCAMLLLGLIGLGRRRNDHV